MYLHILHKESILEISLYILFLYYIYYNIIINIYNEFENIKRQC